MIDQIVITWVREAPFSNPDLAAKHPNFTYDDWFARGRAMRNSVDTLTELLEKEDLKKPSGDGMRVAYALGWIGRKGDKRALTALSRSLGSADVALRIEAASALGRIGDATALSTLESLLKNKIEDINVRANACIAIGRLRQPGSAPLLEETLKEKNSFLAACAKEALRLHGGGQ